MEAEHFNGLDPGDFDIDDKEETKKEKEDAEGDASEKAEKDEMHGTRRGRMLQAADREKTLHYGYNGAAGLEKVNKARGGPKLANENLFFFTDQEYFRSSRFEYLAPAEPTKGFVFALFVPEFENQGSGPSIGNVEGKTVLNSYSSRQ